jgi:hypothetical protein
VIGFWNCSDGVVFQFYFPFYCKDHKFLNRSVATRQLVKQINVTYKKLIKHIVLIKKRGVRHIINLATHSPWQLIGPTFMIGV